MSDERVPFTRVLADVAIAAGPFAALTVLASPSIFCLIGIPIYLRLIGAMHLRVLGATRAHIATWRLGVLGVPLILGPVGAMLVASCCLGPIVGTQIDGRLWQAMVAPLAAMALGAALSPLHAAPFEAIDSGGGLFASMLASGARAAREPMRVTILRGALLGFVGAVPWVTPSVASMLGLEGPVLLLPLVVSLVGSVIVSLAVVAYGWSDGRDRFGAARTRSRTRARVPVLAHHTHGRLAGSLVLALMPAAILGLVVTVALLTPTPASTLLTSDTRAPGDLALEGATSGPTILDEENGLRVSVLREDVWLVETADGGGAGEIRFPHGDPTRAFARRAGSEWSLCVPVRDRTFCARFDREGVRSDDGPMARLAARLDTVGLSLLFAYVAALWGLALAQLRRIGVATGLDAPETLRAHGTAALVGVLCDVGESVVRREALIVRGGTRIDLGDRGSVQLSDGSHALLVAETAPAQLEGATVTVIASLPAGLGAPFRGGAATLPRDAKLVFGTLDHAREKLVERTARSNVAVSLPMLFVALGLSLAILARL